MLRRARIALALFALSTLCAAPAVFAEEDAAGGDLISQILYWLTGVDNGEHDGAGPGGRPDGVQGDEDGGEDEFNPQHLPGG
jgi:hypothetical protein